MARPFRSNLLRSAARLFCAFVLAVGSAALLMAAGCAPVKRANHSQPPSARQQPKAVDIKVQQQYYDRGLQQYSSESYGDAKKSFYRVVEYGPNTLLGLKAQENLKKIERILQTVEEIGSR
jgi:hypothetical protein